MSKTLLHRAAAGAIIAGAALLGTGTASANCFGTANTATACTANAVIYQDCIYTGSGTCKPVSVEGPVCIYGTILRDAYYVTVFCW